MLSMFLSDDMIEKVTNLFKGELEDFLQVSAHGLAFELEQSLDVNTLVRQKVGSFSSEKVEELLTGFMKEEFRFIETIGAALGFLIGCVQVALVILFNFKKWSLPHLLCGLPNAYALSKNLFR